MLNQGGAGGPRCAQSRCTQGDRISNSKSWPHIAAASAPIKTNCRIRRGSFQREFRIKGSGAFQRSIKHKEGSSALISLEDFIDKCFEELILRLNVIGDDHSAPLPRDLSRQFFSIFGLQPLKRNARALRRQIFKGIGSIPYRSASEIH